MEPKINSLYARSGFLSVQVAIHLRSPLSSQFPRYVAMLALLACAASLQGQDSVALIRPEMPAANAATGWVSWQSPTVPAGIPWDGGFGRYISHLSESGHRLISARVAGNSAYPGYFFTAGSGSGRPLVFGNIGSFNFLSGPGSAAMRFDTSSLRFQLSFREMFLPQDPGAGGFRMPDPDAARSARPNSAEIFNVSTTATYGGHQVTGSIRAGSSSMGSVPGGPKHSAPSVGVRLAF